MKMFYRKRLGALVLTVLMTAALTAGCGGEKGTGGTGKSAASDKNPWALIPSDAEAAGALNLEAALQGPWGAKIREGFEKAKKEEPKEFEKLKALGFDSPDAIKQVAFGGWDLKGQDQEKVLVVIKTDVQLEQLVKTVKEELEKSGNPREVEYESAKIGGLNGWKTSWARSNRTQEIYAVQSGSLIVAGTSEKLVERALEAGKDSSKSFVESAGYKENAAHIDTDAFLWGLYPSQFDPKVNSAAFSLDMGDPVKLKITMVAPSTPDAQNLLQQMQQGLMMAQMYAGMFPPALPILQKIKVSASGNNVLIAGDFPKADLDKLGEELEKMAPQLEQMGASMMGGGTP